MRIWCIPVCELDDHRLLGEHSELHAMFTVLTQDRKGYRNHPETKRFEKRLPELVARHADQVAEMAARGFVHKSPLPIPIAPQPYVYTAVEYAVDQASLWERWGGAFRGRLMVGDWSHLSPAE